MLNGTEARELTFFRLGVYAGIGIGQSKYILFLIKALIMIDLIA